MKPKHQRLAGLLIAILIMGGAAAVIMKSFKDQLIFFYTPTQYHDALASGTLPKNPVLRVGGVVKPHSVFKRKDGTLGFVISDLNDEIHVTYHGLVPSLFREGQGVVAQGSFDEVGVLAASSILAKHDENYMPKEVIDQLKKSGEWQHDYKREPVAIPPEEEEEGEE